MSKCLECKYYDKEKHNCPFYCQLIRETLNEAISFELEKIKAEIRNLFEVEVEETGFVYERVDVYCDDVIEILDNHISELKGEQE